MAGDDGIEAAGSVQRTRQNRISPVLGVAAIVVVSMIAGAAGLSAAGRIQANQQKQLLVQQQQGDVQLAEMQLALAEKALDETKRRAAVGLAQQAAIEDAERGIQSLSLKLHRIQLNVDEVQKSGQPVQDEVTSPLVDGRDFVTERLELEQKAAMLATAAAERRLKERKTRVEVGLASRQELLEAEAGMARAAAEMRALQETIGLRQKYLAGQVNAADATRERLLLAARAQMLVAQSELNAARQQYEQMQKNFTVGLVQEVDLLKAQVEMLSKKQDLAALQTRIQMLERGR